MVPTHGVGTGLGCMPSTVDGGFISLKLLLWMYLFTTAKSLEALVELGLLHRLLPMVVLGKFGHWDSLLNLAKGRTSVVVPDLTQ